jgi:hypothetical protein
MKIRLCLLAATTTLVLAGCGQKSDQQAVNPPATNAASTEGNPVTAPADYLRGISKGKQSADKTIDTAALNKAIQLFNVDNGRNPKDLNELVTEKYIPLVPTPPYGTKLEYDASAGAVKVVKQ